VNCGLGAAFRLKDRGLEPLFWKLNHASRPHDTDRVNGFVNRSGRDVIGNGSPPCARWCEGWSFGARAQGQFGVSIQDAAGAAAIAVDG